MPDFERVTRSLELHLAETPEAKAYVRGRHAGLDKARWQVLGLFALTCAAILFVCAVSAFDLKDVFYVIH